MTLEEILSNITILEDNSTFNPAIVVSACCILLIAGIIIVNILHYKNCGEFCALPLSILVIVGCIGSSAFNFWLYNSQPRLIKLQIVTEIEAVSAEQLAEYFTISDVSMGNGQIICDIEPKADCYNEISEFLERDVE